MESLFSDIPAGDGEIANLFYSARSSQAVKGLFLVDIFAKEFSQRSLLYLCSRVFLDFLENGNTLVFLNFNQTNFYSTSQVVELFWEFSSCFSNKNIQDKYTVKRKYFMDFLISLHVCKVAIDENFFNFTFKPVKNDLVNIFKISLKSTFTWKTVGKASLVTCLYCLLRSPPARLHLRTEDPCYSCMREKGGGGNVCVRP